MNKLLNYSLQAMHLHFLAVFLKHSGAIPAVRSPNVILHGQSWELYGVDQRPFRLI